MIHLSNAGLEVELCRPGEYYQGTRFDHAGVFRRIVKAGYVFADEWFDHKDPFRHDRVCGLSEEFVTVDLEDVPVGGLFCKIGVGLLRRPDDAPYDWFRLYEVADPGKWEVEKTASSARFTHRLPGWYRYTKEVRLLDGSRLEIRHSLDWEAPQPLNGFFYNHNFLTFDGTEVGPTRELRFPFSPAGEWRHPYDNAHFTADGVAFTAPVDPADAVYCGNIHNPEGLTPCEFTVREGTHAVHVSGDRLMDHIVLWANPQVACLEPYMSIRLFPSSFMSWTFRYCFE